MYVLPVLSSFNKNLMLCFVCSLLEKIEQETWRETGISFITSVTRLVERLLDYRYAQITMHIVALMFYVISEERRTTKPFFLLQGLHERRRDGDQENWRLCQPHGETVMTSYFRNVFMNISTHVRNMKHLIFFLIEIQNFYKSEVNKEDMYIRYIHKLCDLHLQAEDFTGNRRYWVLFFGLIHVSLSFFFFFLAKQHYSKILDWHWRAREFCQHMHVSLSF